MRTTASKGPVEGTVQLQEYKGKPTQVIPQLPESLMSLMRQEQISHKIPKKRNDTKN
jgi:hypothetical protein